MRTPFLQQTLVLVLSLSSIAAFADGTGHVGSGIDANSVINYDDCLALDTGNNTTDINKDTKLSDEIGRTYFKTSSGKSYYWDARLEQAICRDNDGRFFTKQNDIGNSGYLCEDSVGIVGGTPFYKNFLSIHEGLKYPYTAYYQDVDRLNYLHMKKTCLSPSNQEDMSTFIAEENKVCKSGCSTFAASYHSDDWFFKQSKTEAQINECSQICDMTTAGQNKALAARSSSR